MTDYSVFVTLFLGELNNVMFSYSEAVEIQRIVEAAATPYRAEGANLSEC